MIHRLLVALLLMALIVVGCNVPVSTAGTQAGALRAWFDAPLPNTVVRPPNPCQVVAHGASPGGIAAFELSINGEVSATIPSPDLKSSLVTLTQDCGITQPGTYLLQLRARDNAGQWSGPAETSLIVLGPEAPTPSTSAPISTLTPLATFTPTSTAAGSASIERISDGLIYMGNSSCGPLQVTIVARVTAPKGITVVVLFYRFATGNASSDFQSVAMNPIGGDLYQATLNPTSLLGGSIPFDQATLQYQVVVQQTDNDTSIRTPVMADIAVQACGSVSAAPTNSTCSAYTDKRSCQAHGCNWVSKPGIVPIFVCQAP